MSTEALSPTPADLDTRLKAAEKAVAHMLSRIREEPEIFWHCGDGTTLYDLLTQSRSLSTGKSAEELRRIYRPSKVKYDEYCNERKEKKNAVEFLDALVSIPDRRPQSEG